MSHSDMLLLVSNDDSVMMNRGDVCHDDQLQVCGDAHRLMHVPSQDLRDQVMSSLAHDRTATGHCHGAEEGNDRENQDREAASDGDFRHRWRIPEIHGRPGHHASGQARAGLQVRLQHAPPRPKCPWLSGNSHRRPRDIPREPSGPQPAVSKAKVIVTRGDSRAPREHSDRSGGSGGRLDITSMWSNIVHPGTQHADRRRA